jgi:hypothetical protein
MRDFVGLSDRKSINKAKRLYTHIPTGLRRGPSNKGYEAYA